VSMGSTSTLEVIELSQQESFGLTCEIVWKKVHTNEVVKECGEEATHIATLHCNANDAGRPHPTLGKYVCKSCLEKTTAQMCHMHQTPVLVSYTSL